MTISHCPVTDLNPFAMTMVIAAMEKRIRYQKSRLNRLKRKHKRKGFLWIEQRWRPGQKPLEIKRRFLIWNEPYRSPHDIIADAQERINEIEVYQRSFEDIPIE